MENLTYRLAKKGDGALLGSFFTENVDESYITASEVIWGRATADGKWSENLFQAVAEEIESSVGSLDKVVILFFVDGCLAGYTLSAVKPHYSAEVEDFVLDRGLRGKGLGRKINEITSEYLKNLGCKTLFMEVGKDNARMHSFVTRDGMLLTSTRYWKNL